MNESEAKNYLRQLGLRDEEVNEAYDRVGDLEDRNLSEAKNDLETQARIVGTDRDTTIPGQPGVDSPVDPAGVDPRPEVEEAVSEVRAERERLQARADQLRAQSADPVYSAPEQQQAAVAAEAIESGEVETEDELEQIIASLGGEDEEIQFDPFVIDAAQNWGLDPTDPETQERIVEAYEVWTGNEWDGPLTQEFWSQEFGRIPAQLKNRIILDAAGKQMQRSAIYPTTNGGRLVLEKEEAAIVNKFPELEQHMGRIVQASESTDVPEGLLATLFASMGAVGPVKFGPRVRGRGPTDRGASALDPAARAFPEDEPEEPVDDAEVARERAGRAGLDHLGKQFKQYRDEFNDWTLAFVAMHDEDLARKLYSDPYSLTVDEQNTLGQTLSGWDMQALTDAGVFINPSKYEAAHQIAAGPSGAEGGGTISMPDPAALDESIVTLYRTWFQSEPTPEDLERFRSEVNGEIQAKVKTERGNPFQDSWSQPQLTEQIQVSPEASAIAFMRGRPDYAYLFGAKPPGITEEEYVQQFSAGVQGVLGPETDPQAVRAGMASGRINTAVGAAFFSGAARPEGEESQTLEDRMARAAGVMRRLT